MNALRFAVTGQVESLENLRAGTHFREAGVLFPPIEVIARSQATLRNLRKVRVGDFYKLLGMRIRERLQQEILNDAEDSGVRANSQGQVKTATAVNPGFFASVRAT